VEKLFKRQPELDELDFVIQSKETEARLSNCGQEEETKFSSFFVL
jgi:hypothetical protein